jgi:hypothetical protein
MCDARCTAANASGPSLVRFRDVLRRKVFVSERRWFCGVKDNQRRQHLADYDRDLPEKGFVNLREAEQVVQVLEALLDDPGIAREQTALERAGEQIAGVRSVKRPHMRELYRLRAALVRRARGSDIAPCLFGPHRSPYLDPK